MAEIKIGIVEDEGLIAESIMVMLLNLGYDVLEPVSEFREAIKMLETNKPDLVILDILLNDTEGDGVKIAEYINEHLSIPFIFLTANADAATVARAKKTMPAAYLLKPFTKQDLFATIEVAVGKYLPAQAYAASPYFFFKHTNKFWKVYEMEIIYIESSHVYLHINTKDNKYVHRSTVDEFLGKLSPNRFVKIHRSYIINVNYVNSYDTETVEVNGVSLPISKSHRADFVEKIEGKK